VGLAITQAIGLTGMLQWGMRQSTELENQMTSVERVLEFTNVEQEPPLISPPGRLIVVPFVYTLTNEYTLVHITKSEEGKFNAQAPSNVVGTLCLCDLFVLFIQRISNADSFRLVCISDLFYLSHKCSGCSVI
jgi:hypothetical protein